MRGKTAFSAEMGGQVAERWLKESHVGPEIGRLAVEIREEST